MSEEKKSFTVKDRRIFAEGTEKLQKKEAKKEEKQKKESITEEAKKTEPGIPLPQINFPSFILSLNASALVHLGVIDDPTEGKKIKNLPMGKQTIDILGMLEEKTSGNLSKEEADLLNQKYKKELFYERS